MAISREHLRRRAAIVGEKRRRNEEVAYVVVDADIRGNRYDDEDLERLSRLRVATPQCHAECAGTGRRCKRSGMHHHIDRYYCTTHLNIVMGNRSENRRGTAGGSPGLAHSGVRMLLFRPDETCAVCLSRLDFKCMVPTKCGHFFHPKCLANWRVRSCTCPTCKRASGILRPGNSNYKVVVEVPVRAHDMTPDQIF